MPTVRAPEVTERLVTGEELEKMGDIGRSELIDGRIVRMSPTRLEHGFLENELGRRLGNFVVERRLGWVLTGDVGIYTRRNPDRVRGADVAFFSRERMPGGPPRRGFTTIAPDLAVEVISPDDKWKDIRAKIDEYFGIGVFGVWIVEPEDQTILVFRTATEFRKLGTADVLHGDGALDGFLLPLGDLFAETEREEPATGA